MSLQEGPPIPSEKTMVLFTLGTGLVIGAAVLIANNKKNTHTDRDCDTCSKTHKRNGYSIKGNGR